MFPREKLYAWEWGEQGHFKNLLYIWAKINHLKKSLKKLKKRK